MRRSGRPAERIEFEIEGMHCSSCGMLIDEALEEIEGVASSRTHVRRRRTVVVLSDEALSPGRVEQAIADLGYGARSLP